MIIRLKHNYNIKSQPAKRNIGFSKMLNSIGVGDAFKNSKQIFLRRKKSEYSKGLKSSYGI